MFWDERGDGPPLLLIHGMWGDHLDWEPVLDPLALRRRVVAVDLPGFGRSATNAIEYTAEFFRDRTIQLLDDLRIESCAICGNSFGAQIAMALALEAPKRVEKLILAGSGGLRRFSRNDIEQALGLRSESALRALTPELNAMMFSRLFAEQGGEIQRRYLTKQNAKLQNPGYAEYVHTVHCCMRLAVEYCLLEQLHSIAMPVLFLQGDKDPVVQLEWVREAVPLFPQAQLAVFENCGHVPQLEQPERFVQEVEAFL
jgi:pimeloyl-ACP methyl ester carboxylesterase